jgi:hypothetical protein
MGKQLNNTRLFNDLKTLLELVVAVSDNFPKSHRYVVGAKMQELSISMVRYFGRAYLTRDAGCIGYMDCLVADIESLNVLITISVEKGWINSRNKAARLVRLLDGITKQSVALRNTFIGRFNVVEGESKTRAIGLG